MTRGIASTGLRVVSFDLWLTLIKSNPTPNRANRAAELYEIFAMADRGVTLDDFKGVVKAADVAADKLNERGGHHHGPHDRVRLIAEHYGIPMMTDPDFDAFYAAQSVRFLEFPPAPMQDDVAEVLAALSQRYQLALISNTGFVNGAEMRPALAAIGLLDMFTYQLFSDEVGANKPDPVIYKQLLSQSEANPEQVLHIGDNLVADYEGATAVGMQAIHLTAGMTIRQAVSFLL